ncbi:hypothetical protein P3T26_004351 [Streptomyces sp. MAA16]|nr:hypothetical protein [Streptomyces sp. MAA16]
MRDDLTSGWWCAFAVRPATDDSSASWSGSTAAGSPEQALVWIRRSMRVLVSAFEPADPARALAWLDHGQWEAAARLRGGEPYAFAATSGRTRIEWSVRPARFLPLARAADGPPWPCTVPALCTCVAPGHGCR